MEANELRIGNYLYTGHGISKVLEIKGSGVRVINMHSRNIYNRKFNAKISPPIGIPLTPKVLDKTGFEESVSRDGKCWGINHNGVAIVIHLLASGSFYYGNAVSFNYIHQFQNIVFALTGKELPISL